MSFMDREKAYDRVNREALSQQKVGESLRMEESRREGCIVGRRGKQLERAAANLGQSTRMLSFNRY